jgi:type I site-specific restriction endonuclease
VYCWAALDNFLYQYHHDLYNSERERKEELHEEARKWIADPTQKPLQPKNLYVQLQRNASDAAAALQRQVSAMQAKVDATLREIHKIDAESAADLQELESLSHEIGVRPLLVQKWAI